MKTRNFPAKKLERQFVAQGRMFRLKHDTWYTSGPDGLLLDQARAVRTKKRRSP